MAVVENIVQPSDSNERAQARLHEVLAPMGPGELLAQQITQKGAIHALETLLRIGCTESNARGMLASLHRNMKTIEAVARDKGVTQLFGEEGT